MNDDAILLEIDAALKASWDKYKQPITAISVHSEDHIMDANEPILQFFEYSHLRTDLQDISRPFCELAAWIVESMPRNPERTVCLRKLLEAKDAGVRAMLYRSLTTGP